MKRMKKLLAVMLAAMMVLAMGTSVFAEQASSGKSDGSNSVAITGVATNNHTFTAYQIFKGTLSGSTGSYVLSDIDWGDCVDGSSLLTYLTTSDDVAYNDGSNYTWKSIFASCSDAAAVAEKLTSYSTDSALIKAFADLLVDYVSDYSATTNKADGSGPYTYTISGLDAGYYLITDSYTGMEGKGDSLSDYFLQVAGTTTAVNKTVVPEVTKTIGASDTATTASAGDTVSFTLTGKIPADVTKYYTSYTYKFVDTLSSNLSFNSNSLEVSASTSGDLTDKYSVSTSGQEITITITDAIKYAGQTITVTYNATVGSGIVAGIAETNEVYVVYSNNPNTSDTGTTETKKVYVYTFDLEVVKTDGNGDYVEALSTAGFTLYKKDTTVVSTSDFGSGTTYYTISGTKATGATSYADSTDYYVPVGNEQVVTGNTTNGYKTTFSDLGEGTYALVESTTPSGYNTADAVIFTITASYATGGTSIESLTISNTSVSVKTDYSVLSTTIKNETGATLPSTGGIGTTIFYIIGAILVLGAAVVLVTRRRVSR